MERTASSRCIGNNLCDMLKKNMHLSVSLNNTFHVIQKTYNYKLLLEGSSR